MWFGRRIPTIFCAGKVVLSQILHGCTASVPKNSGQRYDIVNRKTSNVPGCCEAQPFLSLIADLCLPCLRWVESITPRCWASWRFQRLCRQVWRMHWHRWQVALSLRAVGVCRNPYQSSLCCSTAGKHSRVKIPHAKLVSGASLRGTF